MLRTINWFQRKVSKTCKLNSEVRIRGIIITVHSKTGKHGNARAYMTPLENLDSEFPNYVGYLSVSSVSPVEDRLIC
jgi:hypothetical protein